MIIPVRCFTCGKVIGNKYDTFIKTMAAEGCGESQAMDSLGLKRCVTGVTGQQSAVCWDAREMCGGHGRLCVAGVSVCGAIAYGSDASY
jgi:DNA-directed RNA polymerase subunit N (RpoN/RPB10)